jgi:carbon-monoxide dehydrogenase medium subunit
MTALDADVHIQGQQGPRTVKASAFFKSLFAVDLRPDEIITAVQFRPVRASAYAKLPQRASHFAIVGVAAALEVDAGLIRWARIGLTGASSHAMRLTDVETALAGQPASRQSCDAAARSAGATLQDVNADIHASDEYRRAMVAVFTDRALARALERAGERVRDH